MEELRFGIEDAAERPRDDREPVYPPPDDDRARELDRGVDPPELREFDREEFTRGAVDRLPERLPALDELLREFVLARERVRGANVPELLRLALVRGTDELVWLAPRETRELVRGATVRPPEDPFRT